MNTPDYPHTAPLATDRNYHSWWRSVSWPAIFAGIVSAIALQFLFMLLGAGLGFAIYDPITNDNPVTDLGTGAIIIHGISAVVSLWFGGWIAGRFTPVGVRSTGCLHGFLVWCSATVAGVLIVTLGAGWMLGDLSKLVGGGLSMAGKPAAAVAGSLSETAKDAAKQSSDTLSSFIDEAVGNRSLTAPRSESIRAKREIGLAVAKLFNPMQPADSATNRAAAVKALSDYGNMSEAEANRTVNEWTESYNELKADLADAKAQLEEKARGAADKAAKALAAFSFCVFGALLLGAIAASCGGKHGATCATKHDVPVVGL